MQRRLSADNAVGHDEKVHAQNLAAICRARASASGRGRGRRLTFLI